MRTGSWIALTCGLVAAAVAVAIIGGPLVKRLLDSGPSESDEASGEGVEPETDFAGSVL